MKILAVPQPVIAPLTGAQVDRIRAAAAPDGLLVVTSDRGEQLHHAATATVLFGDVQPDVLAAAPRLEWVQSVGSGVDRFAAHLQGRDVRLTCAKGIVGPHLAEHAFALLLAVARGVATAVRSPGWGVRQPLRDAQWELTGRTLVIIGFGGAGRAVARRARGFEFGRVVAIDPEHLQTAGDADELLPPDQLDSVLPDADVVVLTTPLTPATHHLLDAVRLARLKPGAVLVNVSRGGLIDEDALRAALASGRLGGAGLDVTETEPLPDDDPLWTLPNVVITPHVAGGSPHRADRAVSQFCDNLARYRRGAPLLGEFDFAKGY